MASAEDYANWIVRNQDKKGTPEFDTVAKAYQAARDIAPSAKDEPPTKARAPGFSVRATPMDAFERAKQDYPDLLAGAVRGAGSIGATLMAPKDYLEDFLQQYISKKPNDVSRNEQRRQDMTDALESMGADPTSAPFAVGKIGTEILGTAGVGGILGAGAKAGKASPAIVKALQTSGASTGQKLPFWPSLALKTGGGAAGGAAAAALVDPADLDSITRGAQWGGGLAAAGAVVTPTARWLSQHLMQSALKPSSKSLRTGDAQVAIDTLLEKGVSPTRGGSVRLHGMVDDLQTQINNIVATSPAIASKTPAFRRISDTFQKFSKQANPTPDLKAITSVADDFLNHPLAPGPDMPVQLAQQIKQGTYKVLHGKYGEVGSASTEAQKALARGLKDEIATKVPGIAGLNAEESRLLKTLDLSEYRALEAANSNPMGLTWMSGNPTRMAAFMADRSTAFKALLARIIYRNNQLAEGVGPAIAPMAGVFSTEK